MEQKEFSIKGYDFTFRFKQMNAIEILALQSQFKFNTFEQSKDSISIVLEHTEVKVGNDWTDVKLQGREVFTPDVVGTDVNLIAAIMTNFTNDILKPVFLKSDESKK